MADYFVIRLGQSADAAVSWIVVDDRGTRRGQPGKGSLADAAREVRGRAVIALVPASEVVTLSADIPAKGAKLQAALPFALEDQVADELELLHFAAGARRDDGSIPVAVVRRQTLSDWLTWLSDAGIEANRIVPENHGLAKTPNTMSMLVGDGLVMFNDGERTEFVIADMNPSEALAAAGILGSEESAGKHLLVYCDPTDSERYEKDWALLRHELASVDVNQLPDGALPRLAVTVASGAGVNLLQGGFGPKTEFADAFRPWRFAAMFLLALGALGIVAKATDYYRLSVERDALQAQFADEYRRVRPNDTREVLDPTGTVNSLRRAQGGAAAGPQVFLPSLQQLAAAVASHESVKIEAISYRAGVVDVRLTAPDIPTVDDIVQSVGDSGRFTASMQSADSVGEQIASRIQIREAGA